MNDSNAGEVIRYYKKTESRLGYALLLNGTKHFGYYDRGPAPWQFERAMIAMSDQLGQRLDLSAGSKVLDAGCGVGDVARRMASTFSLRVTGIDILDFNIAKAQRRVEEAGLADMVDLRLMDYNDLDFGDETFDGAYTMETLVHATDPGAVLAGFRRVLRPGGRLVLFEYSHDPYASMNPRAASMFQEINSVAAMPAFDEFEHGVLKQMLADAGFDAVQCTDASRHIWPMLRMFAFLGHVPYIVGSLSGKKGKVPNAMSGVELWRYRRLWRYNMFVATRS